jgi:hypothetical protein
MLEPFAKNIGLIEGPVVAIAGCEYDTRAAIIHLAAMGIGLPRYESSKEDR